MYIGHVYPYSKIFYQNNIKNNLKNRIFQNKELTKCKNNRLKKVFLKTNIDHESTKMSFHSFMFVVLCTEIKICTLHLNLFLIDTYIQCIHTLVHMGLSLWKLRIILHSITKLAVYLSSRP